MLAIPLALLSAGMLASTSVACDDVLEACTGSLGPYSSAEYWASECLPGGPCATQSLEPSTERICRIELTLSVHETPTNATLYIQEAPTLTPDIVATSETTMTESGLGVVAAFDFDDARVVPGRQYFLRLAAGSALWIGASHCTHPSPPAYVNGDPQSVVFWHRIEGDFPILPTHEQAWGEIKAVYR